MSCRQVRFRTSRTHLARVVGAVEPPAGGAANEERDADDEDDGDGDEAADLLRCRDHRRHFREGGRNSGGNGRLTAFFSAAAGRSDAMRCRRAESRDSRRERYTAAAADMGRRRGAWPDGGPRAVPPLSFPE